MEIDYHSIPIDIINNGHSVQINANQGKIKYRDDYYDLKQFHFHTHSEHHIDGQPKPMEVHFVHQNPETNVIVVLGVFVEGGGNPNSEFDKYLQVSPETKLKDFVLEETINPTEIIPNSPKYYTYRGSLTTSPCSQGLSWVIMKETIKISDEQLQSFHDLYTSNTREIQNLGSRIILESL